MCLYVYAYLHISKQTHIDKILWEDEEPFAFGLISFTESYAAQFSAIFTIFVFDV